MKLKQRILLIWYYFTFQEVGYKAMARELMPKQNVGYFLHKMFSEKESVLKKFYLFLNKKYGNNR